MNPGSAAYQLWAWHQDRWLKIDCEFVKGFVIKFITADPRGETERQRERILRTEGVLLIHLL